MTKTQETEAIESGYLRELRLKKEAMEQLKDYTMATLEGEFKRMMLEHEPLLVSPYIYPTTAGGSSAIPQSYPPGYVPPGGIVAPLHRCNWVVTQWRMGSGEDSFFMTASRTQCFDCGKFWQEEDE